MRIAQIAPVELRVPPKAYGGIERIISTLTEELVRRGHEVTLFASGDSVTAAKLESTEPLNTTESGIKTGGSYNAPLLRSIGHAYTRARDFDIIHTHVGGIGLPLAETSPTPVVMTLHGHITTAHAALYHEFTKPYAVAISKDQSKDHTKLNSAGVIYHGLAMEHYPFSSAHDGYLLNVGRITPDKGTHHAVEVARRLDLPLIIAAKLENTPAAQQYFKEKVEPYLTDKIQWVGEVDENRRNELMSRAMCFLHPATWREPFGLVLIEAMACGAPVVAFDRGAAPEIVEAGKTGFTVGDEDKMVDAVKRISEIDRTYTRAYTLKNFSAKRMVDDYEALYERILATQQTKLK